jgi:Domain of unknown function (DUF1905)/Bacteriocin-protection, YdeI or OmpD-Associated
MTNEQLRFKVKLAGGGMGAVCAISPPLDVPEFFGTRARVPVRGTINGFPFRSSLMPMGGCHMMPVNKTLRDGAGVKAGDIVDVVMERDEEKRTVEAPAVLKKALRKNKVAKANWEKMAFTHKKEMAIWLEGAKQEETRARRLSKAMHVLEQGTRWTG